MNYKEMGQRIMKERINLNISREKMAESIDLSPNFVGQIERGEKNMSLETLIKICQYLNVSIDYIIYGYVPEYKESDIQELKYLIENCTKRELSVIKDMIKAALKHITD